MISSSAGPGLRARSPGGPLTEDVHPSFFWEFAGRVGAPIFAATLVACLLSGHFTPLHGVLMGVGLAMMAVCHWWRVD